MPATQTPLRYPGGKSSINKQISNIITTNNLVGAHYIEPYAGGCGLALTLLFNNIVDDLYLNDLDRSIYCFWHQILHNTQNFINKINDTEITIKEWHKQRKIQQSKDSASDLDLAFSTFFLNRTNRSGIILKAGVIGGKEQKSKYKLDCRFNKQNLIKKILKISSQKDRINLYNMDAIDFLNMIKSEVPPENSFYFIDPPYFNKGHTLYTNFYNETDHTHIANFLNDFDERWVLTYDNTIHIKELYNNRKQFNYYLSYSAGDKKRGDEIFISSDTLSIVEELYFEPA